MIDRTLSVSALFVIPFLLVGCGGEPTEEDLVRPVRAMKVADLESITEKSFPGRASASQEVDLAFRVAGPLVYLPVKVGDQIQEGDLIARIDPRDFEVAVRNAEGSLQRAQATRARAQADLDRNTRIREQSAGAVTQATIDENREAVNVAAAEIIVWESTLTASKDALTDTELRAPFSGTIVATFAENFENVRAQQMIVRLLDISKIEFEVNIPESMISLVPYVQDLKVRFDAFPEVELSAEGKEVGAEASPTTRTFPVTLVMDQPAGVTILPGMAGRVQGATRATGEGDQVNIVVPASAVFSPNQGSETFVWVIDPTANTVKRRAVQLGLVTNGGFLVESGLKAGELIATAGANFLKEGQQVQPELE